MGALYEAPVFSNSGYNLLFQEQNSKIGVWTKEENKKFERALAIYDDKTLNRWAKVASMIPGKSEWDVMNQYKELLDDVSDIEAGYIPVPGYLTSPFTLDWGDETSFDPFRKTSMARPHDHDRKKGVPWTQDEHRRFLLGLQKHGKGDWRNISRNFVMSKTPTQVASHAQKYFLRQNSGGKDKRRPSIHDITTANVTKSLSDASDQNHETLSTSYLPKVLLDWTNSNGEALMVFNGRQNLFTNTCQGAYVGSN